MASAQYSVTIGRPAADDFSLEVILGGWKRLLMERPVQATMNAEVRNLDALKRILEA